MDERPAPRTASSDLVSDGGERLRSLRQILQRADTDVLYQRKRVLFSSEVESGSALAVKVARQKGRSEPGHIALLYQSARVVGAPDGSAVRAEKF